MMNSNSLHNMARKYHRRLMLFGGLVTAILVTACLLMLLVLGACTNEALVSDAGTEIGTDTNALRFDISIAPAEELENTAEEPGTTRSRTCVTRATTDALFRTAFEDGDAIGIFALNATDPTTVLTASGNPIHNARLTYDAATATWKGDIRWPEGFTGSLHFCAYYPYDDCGGHPERMNPTAYVFRAATDQNATATAGRDPYSLSDLMGAYNHRSYTKADLTAGSVSLTFRHLMAMVQVSVPAGTKGSGPDETLAVRLNNVRTEAKLNLNEIGQDVGVTTKIALANPQSDPATLIMRRVEQPGDPGYATTYTYRALLPVQDLPPATRLIRLDYGPWTFADAPLTGKLELLGGIADIFTRALPAKVTSTAFIPAGEFLMGSPASEEGRDNDSERQHRVTLTRGFYMSRYLVTNAQFAAFLNDIKCGEDGKFTAANYAAGQHPGRELVYNCIGIGLSPWGMTWDRGTSRWMPVSGYEDYPAIYVSWYGADEYARWMGGTLPTDAQWERACRAGTTTAYYFGNDATQLGEYAWYNGNSGNTTHPVGTKLPNAWGLYDMYGNVDEWCSDWYADNYGSTPDGGITDPTGPGTGSRRVLRGGNYNTIAKYCRSACRIGSYPPDAVRNHVGFRIVIPQP